MPPYLGLSALVVGFDVVAVGLVVVVPVGFVVVCSAVPLQAAASMDSNRAAAMIGKIRFGQVIDCIPPLLVPKITVILHHGSVAFP
jgi:hypothetical protein